MSGASHLPFVVQTGVILWVGDCGPLGRGPPLWKSLMECMSRNHLTSSIPSVILSSMNDFEGTLPQLTSAGDYDHLPIPLPGSSSSEKASLAVVLCDNKTICVLIETILHRSGMTQAEVCRRLGISSSNFNQYRLGRRMKPSVWWLARLIDVCGGRLFVEFPPRPIR